MSTTHNKNNDDVRCRFSATIEKKNFGEAGGGAHNSLASPAGSA